MPKVTKKLGNNKARAWESLGFAHKKKLCQHFDTTSLRKKRKNFAAANLLFKQTNLKKPVAFRLFLSVQK